jgi:hypothetical protein
MLPPRRAGTNWPRIANPAIGCLPPIAAPRRAERVLHVSLTPPHADGRVHGLQRCLQSIATEFAEVYWPTVTYTIITEETVPRARSLFDDVAEDAPTRVHDAPATRFVNGVFMNPGSVPTTVLRTSAEPAILEAAGKLRPTLVFLQLQSQDPMTAESIVKLRELCAPDAVIVNWDGDQHYEPTAPERRWFVDIGRQCDASLLASSGFQDAYASLGVRHPGYLQCGIDPEVFHPAGPPQKPVPPLVLLANHYPHLNYSQRVRAVQTLSKQYKETFAVYGVGWRWVEQASCLPLVDEYESSAVYSAARGSVSISIRNDLARYTSDRLFRALAAGAIVLFERVPDWEGLGLEDGGNCLCWTGMDELMKVSERALAMPDSEARAMRSAAVELGARTHNWQTRSLELLAIVDAIREERRTC